MNKILAFKAHWCQPCKNMIPILESMPEDTVKVYDIDENKEMVSLYEVRAVPTFIVVDKFGTELNRIVGATSKSNLLKHINV